jgi:hypothetical protein
MSLNKKVLATAVLASLAVPALAVTLSPGTAIPVKYPTELIVSSTARVTLVNDATLNQLDISSAFNYAFSAGEVRYARVECSPDVRFNSNSAVTTDANVTAGAINGLGSSVITFSVTAGGTGAPSSSFTVTGDRSVSSTGDATCSYSLYDTPSQAQAGGSAGRIVGVTGNYLDFVTSYAMSSSGSNATANVEAPGGAYTSFLVSNTNVQTVSLGSINTALTSATIFEADGTYLTFGEIIGATSKHLVSGDFTAVANANGTFTGTALNRVWLDPGSSCTVDGGEIFAASITTNTATFNTGTTPLAHLVCYQAEGSTAINEADFSVTWDVVSANSARYTTPDIGPQALGSIRRNGTQIQAPLVQTPDGYLSRIALTNTGNLARAYTVRVIDEEGNSTTLNNAALSGTIQANSTKIISVNSIIASYTGNSRATIVMTVAAPNNQIQGLYQIVNPGSGSISNHVMVRPGTN